MCGGSDAGPIKDMSWDFWLSLLGDDDEASSNDNESCGGVLLSSIFEWVFDDSQLIETQAHITIDRGRVLSCSLQDFDDKEIPRSRNA